MENDETFELGKYYSSRIMLEPAGEYYFDDPLVYINGSTDDLDDAYTDGDALGVWTASYMLKGDAVLPENTFFVEDFESFDDSEWTFLGEDGDGFTWEILEQEDELYRIYEGEHCVISQ